MSISTLSYLHFSLFFKKWKKILRILNVDDYLSPVSFFSSFALSVFSQVKSGSSRPKCPYAAVFLKIGLCKSNVAMISLGVVGKNSSMSFSIFSIGILSVPKHSILIETGFATPIA